MAFNLTVVVSNPEPKREQNHPRAWLLHAQGQDPVEVHVKYDSARKAYVVDKSAA